MNYCDMNIYDLGSLLHHMIAEGLLNIEIGEQQWVSRDISIISVIPGEIFIKLKEKPNDYRL